MTTYVLLHGFAQTARSWDEVAAALRAHGRTVYAPDLYAQVKPLAMDAACAYVAQLVRDVARREGEPAALVGYSMGGRIALETLVRFGGFDACGGLTDNSPVIDDVCEGADGSVSNSPADGASRAGADFVPAATPLPLAALVLEGAGLGPRNAAERETLTQRNAAWAHDLREGGVEAFMDWWETLPLFATQQTLSHEARARVRADRVAHTAEELAQSLKSCGQHRQAAEREALAALACLAQAGVPVRYIAGELDAKYAACAQRLTAAVPQANATLIPQAGHNTHLEQPRKFVEAVVGCA